MISSTKVFSSKSYWALLFLFLALPLVHWLSLGPLIPERTFLLISQLTNINTQSDPSNIIYYFARPPIHSLLGWIFSNPLAFLLIGFVAHAVLNLMLFTLIYQGIGMRIPNTDKSDMRIWIAALITSLIYPIGLLSGLASAGTGLIPHDAYHSFSFRTLFLIITAISFLFLLNKKHTFALLLSALSCYIHPSAGILWLGLVLITLIPQLLKPVALALSLSIILALAIGAAPSIYKLFYFQLPPELINSVSYADWYSQIIKDEADDFSILYQLIVYPLHTARLILANIIILAIYSQLNKNYRQHYCFWFALLCPVLFMAGAVIEYFFAVLYPTPIIHLLIALTPGYRLLSFAFLPLIVLSGRILYLLAYQLFNSKKIASLINRASMTTTFKPQVITISIILSSFVLALSYGAWKGNVSAAINYGHWATNSNTALGIDQYLEGIKLSGKDSYGEPHFYLVDGKAVTYPHERNIAVITKRDEAQPNKIKDSVTEDRLNSTAFISLIKNIRRLIPKGEGLFVPPYLRYFRDALPQHPIFFQEHHDGNLMMGSPKFTYFWSKRMEDLLGFTYEGLPSRYTGLSFTTIRTSYLKLDEEKLNKLRNKYPQYRYFITESIHKLNYQAIIKTNSYNVYDLHSPLT